MRYLLDTHALLWYFADSESLTEKAAEVIEHNGSLKYVSTASLWEFTIKQNLGKLQFEGGISALYSMIQENHFQILDIQESYLVVLSEMPLIHRDPFDRLIIATAISEGMTILTADSNIHKYEVRWIW